MLSTFRSRLTYANVMSTIAVFAALSGGVAYAANTVFSGDIADGEVMTQDLANNAVSNQKLGFDSVTGSRIVNGAIQTQDIQDFTITGSDFNVNTIGSSKIQDDSLTGNDVLETSLNPLQLGKVADSHGLDGLGSTAFLRDLTGSVKHVNMAMDSVDSTNIEDFSIARDDMVGDAIGTDEVEDGSLTREDLDESALGQGGGRFSATLDNETTIYDNPTFATVDLVCVEQPTGPDEARLRITNNMGAQLNGWTSFVSDSGLSDVEFTSLLAGTVQEPDNDPPTTGSLQRSMQLTENGGTQRVASILLSSTVFAVSGCAGAVQWREDF